MGKSIKILLLCTLETSFFKKNADVKFVYVHAAFPLNEENISYLFIKTLLQLSDSPYHDWEKNESHLNNRLDEIKSFINSELEEFIFEDKKFFQMRFELDEDVDNPSFIESFKGPTPKIYAIYDKDLLTPIKLESKYELGNNTLIYTIPLITKHSYPGLSLDCNMPFKMIDKKYQMIDKEGKHIGDPYKWALIIDYDFYWVGMDDINGYIDMSSGYIINKEGVKITEEGVKVEEFNICNGFIFITKNKKWGFISAKGEACNPMFDEIREIKEGSWFGPIEVRLGEKWGFVTKNFEFVTEEQLKVQKYDLFDYRYYID